MCERGEGEGIKEEDKQGIEMRRGRKKFVEVVNGVRCWVNRGKGVYWPTRWKMQALWFTRRK